MLAREEMGRLLWKLSLPATVGMMVQALYNVVDTWFVGQFTGTLGLGGTAVAFPIQMILIGIGMTIGIGGASILSRRMGERNYEGASFALGNMIMLSLVAGVAAMIVGLTFMEPLLRIFGANAALMPYAKDYIGVILLGSPFITFSMVASAAARAEGNAKISMYMLMIGGVLNVFLDYVFIVPFGMGVMGAAIATVISIIASCIFLLSYLLSGKSEVALKLRHLRLNGATGREMCAVGSSDFARTAAMSLTFAVFNNILRGLGGETPIAAYGIAFRVFTFIFMPMIGIAQGAQPILGFNFGARQFDRVRDGLSLACRTATMIGVAGFAVFLIFPGLIVGFFSNDPKLIETGTIGIRLMALGFPLVGYQNIGTSLFQAIGKAKPAIFLAFSRQILFLIPVVFILSHAFGLPGVWLSYPVADVISFAVTFLMVSREMRRLARGNMAGAKAAEMKASEADGPSPA